MSFGTLQGLLTLALLGLFVGIVWWTWSARRREDFERAARIPFDEDPFEREVEPREDA
jgi:cytochrome c oxidase cbb3-type subunit 4